jgi:hypothetical protein
MQEPETKKKTYRELIDINVEMNNLLKNVPLSLASNERLHFLVKRKQELQLILKPKTHTPYKSNISEKSNAQLDEIQKKYNSLQGAEIGEYCQNCGAPNSHNVINGKPWCLNCNRPLIITYKKPLQKTNPKLKGVTVEEQEQFFLRQKQLGVKA